MEKECPKCGCKEIGKGKMDSGYARMMPVGKLLSMGSAIIADICLDCGHILQMKVADPEKFRDRY